jgi:hypothetical protein
MNTQAVTRSSHQPLGGASGDWRHRLLRYHLPLALASGVYDHFHWGASVDEVHQLLAA